MTGMDLYMHDYEPTGGDVRNPTFWVHAEQGILNEDDGLWTLENARVVVYRNEKEDIIVRAANCTFDQKNDVATLRNGLDLRAGTVTMKLEEIQWDNESGVARSIGEVLVAKGGTRLKASAMSLRPADGSFVLNGVSGRLEFDGEEF